MAEFDLVMIPSRLEGLSLVAIEAMLAGVPVVGTDARGLREVLPPDHPWRAKAGDAASFSEQLQHALDQREQWPLATARAMAFARARFDYQAMLSSYAALYRRAVDARSH
jgi:glycosyltransferase involved in cell wall biosynthesis